MPDIAHLERILADATIDDEVFALRPDYRPLLVVVGGIAGGPSDATSERLLTAAEEAARDALQDRPATERAHVAAWREAYRAFGAKPGRTRNSLESLVRRVEGGLPRVNRLTDIYNAISVIHQIPLGGEDLDYYDGPPRLVRAAGDEPFDTVADGAPVVEHPEPGEVVWRDDAGVTCRCWNWRQARRIQLGEGTTTALFIFDALDPRSDDALHAAADDLVGHPARPGPDVRVARRLIAASPISGQGA